MIHYGKNDLLILSTKETLDTTTYTEIIKELSLGLYQPKIYPL